MFGTASRCPCSGLFETGSAVLARPNQIFTIIGPRGSATWKRKKIHKGAEPDTSFYVANAPRIIGKRKLDLESDPPPDIVVEIDTTNESLTKFSIYAGVGVPKSGSMTENMSRCTN